MYDFIKKEELPKNHTLSPHLLEKADHFLVIMLYGNTYYLPIGFKERKLFGLHIRKGELSWTNWDVGRTLTCFIQDIIAVIYLQIRDTVGSEITATLMQDIHQHFDNMFEDKLFERVKTALPKPETPNDK